MPTLDEKQNDKSSPLLLRLFFYGPPKTRKTWLAGTAAEAGFNTILLDADHGYHILTKQLSADAKKRLQLFECRDSRTQAIACEFLTRFLTGGRVFFNDKTHQVISNQTKVDDDCSELNVSRHIDSNTVLIVDSYTAIVASLQLRHAIENKTDLFNPVKDNTDREGYAWSGALATTFLKRLTALPCHVIVIGHATMYEKYKTDSRGKQTLEWSRRQIKSTSNPHGMTIGDKFSDIFYFHNVSSTLTKVDTFADKDAEGGSRIIPPKSYSWDDVTWIKLCEAAGIQLPPKDLPYLNFKPEITQGGSPTTAKPNAISTKPKATVIKSLTSKN